MDPRQQTAINTAVSDRTPRPLMGPVLSFNLPQEISALRGEVEYQKGHNARTLIKHSQFRVVLVALKTGASVHENQAEQCIAVQPVCGHIRLHLPDEVINMHPDQLLSLDRKVTYHIEGVEDSAFLMWVGWSED